GARSTPSRGWTSTAMPGVAGGVSTGKRETEKREYGSVLEANIVHALDRDYP
ncbi:unnamed protein product, partial [Ectocarpus sp. 4 AP-2014]